MDNFFTTFLHSIDWVIVGLVMCCGFFQKRYMKGIKFAADASYDSALKTLALSFVVCLIYIGLLKHDGDLGKKLSGYFISYFTATSLYELLIGPFTAWFKTKMGGDK